MLQNWDVLSFAARDVRCLSQANIYVGLMCEGLTDTENSRSASVLVSHSTSTLYLLIHECYLGKDNCDYEYL